MGKSARLLNQRLGGSHHVLNHMTNLVLRGQGLETLVCLWETSLGGKSGGISVSPGVVGLQHSCPVTILKTVSVHMDGQKSD